jgi:hypothetical protein
LSIQLKANLLRKIYNLSNDNQANISIEKSKLDKYQYIIDELIEHENW